MLVTAPFCCNQKVQAASAQSFTLRHQATIEIMCRNHSIIACLRHIYILLFFMPIPFVVNHTFNATTPERLQQVCLWTFTFESFYGHHLQHYRNPKRECSRLGRNILNGKGSDVVENVTFKTKTWLKFGDRDRNFIIHPETRDMKLEIETRAFKICACCRISLKKFVITSK